MRKITKIENTKLTPVKRKRVAAYARVSTGHTEQLHSLSAQISYYNNYIGNRGDWELVGIYADAAQTGTKDDRPGLKRLLTDCRAQKIDMVIDFTITISIFCARQSVSNLLRPGRSSLVPVTAASV